MSLPEVSITLPVITLRNSFTDNPYLVDTNWYDTVGKKLDVIEWPNSDGASDQDPVYNTAKYVEVVGRLSVADDTQVFMLRRQLAPLIAYRGKFEMSVTDPLGTKTAQVQMAGQIRYVIDRTDGTATFTIPMLAPDGVMYGESRSLVTGLPNSAGGLVYPLFDPSGALSYGSVGDLGRVTLTNGGTAEVWPTAMFNGELTSGFFAQKLTTGEVVRYDRIVPAGSFVSIDFRTGEVLIDGTSDGSTYLTRYEFFSVMPGESFEVQFNAIGGSSGTPQMTLTISDGDH